MSDAEKDVHRAFAEAALRTLRSPTEAMLEAGPPEPYMDAYVWAKMIDAAHRVTISASDILKAELGFGQLDP